MTHPSAEEVAEHLEGLLDAEAERRVGGHLRQCADCAAVARDLGALPEALRAAATEVPLPDHVADRVQAAIEAEVRHDDEGAGASGHDVAALEDRRRRRRRVMAGGLLAAAAATVVAVGVGQMLRSEGSGQAGGSAGVASLEQASPGPGRSGDQGIEGGPARPDAAAAEKRAGDALSAAGHALDRRTLTALVAGVAAAHTTGTAPHDRDLCVTAALGRPAARSGAAYAVRLPAPMRGVPGVVVLRPADAPTEGVLVACGPRPRVLLREALPG
jgi:hypothetical protein